MFKISEIKELIKLLDQTSVQELEIENEGFRLALRKPGRTEVVAVNAGAAPQAAVSAPLVVSAPAPAPAVEAVTETKPVAAKQEELHSVTSPMVGTFYSASSPDAAPFVQVGSKVHEKSVVCILEAMKLMNEVEADVKGEIVEVLVENGQLVEYGQPLFLVKPE
ncbi:acetyl-CoA carboxylase biotin carboxyl carrier protein [Paenibacillus marinisediminis]